ncbi:hypothetical protein BASA81_008103 [Batrachochytrium salamandrivorans]|nr:hypothetical protein BASA81_008103 [Batrachochytrium salamandrivorans]
MLPQLLLLLLGGGLGLLCDALRSSTPEVGCTEFTPPGSPFKYRYCHQHKIEQFINNNPTKAISLGRYEAKLSTTNEHVFTHGDLCVGSKTHINKPRQTVVMLSSSKQCCLEEALGVRVLGVQEVLLCEYRMDVCVPNSSQCRHQTPEEQQTKFVLPKQEREGILDQIRAVFYHGYNAYWEHAFPEDELQPLTCRGVESDLTPGKMLTLIDAMDTLVVLGNITEFHRVVHIISQQEHTLFKVDKTISVFETTIRILGGLISAHLICEDEELGARPSAYNGSLLRMAVDLGNRLLPAFDSPTKIPFGTVDLLRGVPIGETSEACTAAAGSLSLEFGLLSTLTGDSKYFLASRNALKAIFELRSPQLNLLGRHLDIKSGQWTEPIAGIGSNIDSIYEYYLKQYILFGDDESLEWFNILYEGAVRHLRVPVGNRFYHEVDMRSGKVTRRLASALQAFWSGMQVLAGDVTAATKTLNGFMAIANEFVFLPEDFDVVRWTPITTGNSPSYLLRPELIESLFYVYQATGDESWLLAGKQVVNSVIQHCYVPQCGFASIRDVTSPNKHKIDSMPSFFLSEWVKYAYLLFDTTENPFNRGNWVFTTEAHPFRVTKATQDTFTFITTKQPQPHEAAQVDDIPSLDNPGMCIEFDSTNEAYYMAHPDTQSQSFRPFVLVDAPSQQQVPIANTMGLSVAQEQKHSGILEGVGPFDIFSTYNSFKVTRTDSTKDTVLLSNIDSSTAMITFGKKLTKPVFLRLSAGEGIEFAKQCEISIAHSNVCGWGPMIDFMPAQKLPCSISEGFGDPKWFEFHQDVGMLPVFSYPSLCNEHELMLHKIPTLGSGQKFFVHALRGGCGFEDKALMARKLGAFALVVSLLDKADEFFVMTASSSATAAAARLIPAVPTFLFHGELNTNLTGKQLRVDLFRDTRASCSLGKVNVHAFPDWMATFNLEREDGMFKIHLQRA